MGGGEGEGLDHYFGHLNKWLCHSCQNLPGRHDNQSDGVSRSDGVLFYAWDPRDRHAVFSYRDWIYIGDIILADVVIRYTGFQRCRFWRKLRGAPVTFLLYSAVVCVASEGRADIRQSSQHARVRPDSTCWSTPWGRQPSASSNSFQLWTLGMRFSHSWSTVYSLKLNYNGYIKEYRTMRMTY